MFIAVAFFLTAGSGTVAASEPSAIVLTDHAAIRVNNDTELAKLIADNSWTGDGSAGSPYLITALKIDALDGPNTIFIGNTTAHVVISDCELFNVSYVNWPYAYGSAVMLFNTTNIVVENNTIHDCDEGGIDVIQSDGIVINNNTVTNVYYGIDLYTSENSEVSDNVISSSLYSGVYIFWSNDSVVSDNICHGSGYGLYLSAGDGNTISNNDFSQNSYCMFITYYSTNNTLTGNNCSSGSDYGIYMEFSDLNTISYNNCSNEPLQGVYLSYCENNTIAHNTLNGNGEDGIFMEYSNNNTISYNTATNNIDGAHIEFSNYNTVTGNNLSGNSDGIYMYVADHNLITGNTCDDNQYVGIYLSYECNNNTASNNECHKNSQYGMPFSSGFQISNSNHNIISNNNVSDNWYSNIGVFASNNNTISGNTVYGSSYSAVYLRAGSCYNTISNNDCTNVTGTGNGIGLDSGCYNNTIIGNDVSGRYYGLIIYRSSNNTLTDNLCGECYFGIFVQSNSPNNTLSGNDVSGSACGIFLLESSYNTIADNQCDGCQNGMLLASGSCYNLIVDNEGTGCWYGMSFSTDCNFNTISRNAFSTSSSYGLYMVDGCQYNSIKDNEFTECANSGIYLINCPYNTIDWNICERNNVGIALRDSVSCIMANNTCHNSYAGIIVDDSVGATIENNTCLGYGGEWGIAVLSSSNCRVLYNTCGNSETGIYLSGDGLTMGSETVAHNTCSDCLYCGIYLGWTCSSIIESNHCVNNLGFGIVADSGSCGDQIINNVLNDNNEAGLLISENSNGNLVRYNVISRNIIGIEMESGCAGNLIIGNAIVGNEGYGVHVDGCNSNTFINNKFIGNNGATEVFDEDHVQANDTGSNSWSTGAYGNYWADWVSPDENNDGIVDLEYHLDGNSANQDHYPLAITLDIVSPASGSAQSDLRATVSGIGRSVYFGIDEMTWYNAATGVSGVCSGTSSWSCDIDLKEGENLITITMWCSNGMEITDTVMIYRDTTAPTATITFPSAGGYATPDVNMKWTASDDYSGVWTTKVALDGGWWVFVDGDSYTFEGLSQGAHVLHLKVTDKCGNTFETSVTFTVDAVRPTIDITSPAEGYHNGTGSVTVKWTASDAMSGIDYYLVSADGKTWTKVNVTSFTLAGLDEGEYTVLVRAYDKAGNYNETSVGIVVDMTAPTAGITPSGAGNPIDAVIRVEFSEAMDTSSVTIVVSGVTGTVSWSDNVATFTPSSLTAGAQYIVVVSGKDLAGNAFTANGTFSVAATGSIAGRLIDADGNPMANMTVTLDNGMSVKTDSDGRFAFEGVSPGAHELKVSADGYDTATRDVTVEAGKTIDAHTMQLEESSEDDSTTIVIAIAAIVIIVALAGAMFVMRGKKA